MVDMEELRLLRMVDIDRQLYIFHMHYQINRDFDRKHTRKCTPMNMFYFEAHNNLCKLADCIH